MAGVQLDTFAMAGGRRNTSRAPPPKPVPFMDHDLKRLVALCFLPLDFLQFDSRVFWLCCLYSGNVEVFLVPLCCTLEKFKLHYKAKSSVWAVIT